MEPNLRMKVSTCSCRLAVHVLGTSSIPGRGVGPISRQAGGQVLQRAGAAAHPAHLTLQPPPSPHPPRSFVKRNTSRAPGSSECCGRRLKVVGAVAASRAAVASEVMSTLQGRRGQEVMPTLQLRKQPSLYRPIWGPWLLWPTRAPSAPNTGLWTLPVYMMGPIGATSGRTMAVNN